MVRMDRSEEKQPTVITKDDVVANYSLLKAYLPVFALNGPPPVEQHKAPKLEITQAVGLFSGLFVGLFPHCKGCLHPPGGDAELVQC